MSDDEETGHLDGKTTLPPVGERGRTTFIKEWIKRVSHIDDLVILPNSSKNESLVHNNGTS